MSTQDHILALDPGTKLGFARWSSRGEFKSGRETLKGEGAPQRLAHARLWLAGLVIKHDEAGDPITAVYAENYRAAGWAGANNSQSIEFQTMLKGVVTELCATMDVPLVLVTPETWRKSFLGVGRMAGKNRLAWKRLAVERCEALGLSVDSDDEAEAVGILHHARCQHDPLFAYQSGKAWRAVA